MPNIINMTAIITAIQIKTRRILLIIGEGKRNIRAIAVRIK